MDVWVQSVRLSYPVSDLQDFVDWVDSAELGCSEDPNDTQRDVALLRDIDQAFLEMLGIHAHAIIDADADQVVRAQAEYLHSLLPAVVTTAGYKDLWWRNLAVVVDEEACAPEGFEPCAANRFAQRPDVVSGGVLDCRNTVPTKVDGLVDAEVQQFVERVLAERLRVRADGARLETDLRSPCLQGERRRTRTQRKFQRAS